MAVDASPVEGANWLAPHLAPVFVAGMVGAGIVVASDRVRRLPWGWFAVLAAVPVVALGVVRGSVWTVNHAIAPAMTMLNSLSLIHLPIVLAVIRRVALHFVSPGLPTFGFTLIVALPVSVLGASLFSRIFEIPLKGNRSWKSMIALGRSHWTGRSARDLERL